MKVFFRHSGSKSDKACRRCATIRTFVFIAAILIAAIPLAPEKIKPLSGFIPMHFALGLMALGTVAFGIRWWQWQRESAQVAVRRQRAQ